MTQPSPPQVPAAPAGSSRPGPNCPARTGASVSIHDALFILTVDDCTNGPDRKPTATEISGYFTPPHDTGHDDDDDVILTGGFEVPIASPIARLARQVSASLASIAAAGDILRRNVTTCPCQPCGECPALNNLQLLQAMEATATS